MNENKNVSIPPLHWACGIGNPQVINLLIESGANPQMVDGNGKTPLAYTLCSNNPAAVDALLAHGAGLPAGDLRKLVEFYFIPALKYESTDCLRPLFKKILLAGNEELAVRYMVLLWVVGIEELSPYIPRAYLIPLIEEILESDWLLRNFVVVCVPDFLKLIPLCRIEIQESVLQKRGTLNDNLAHWGAARNNISVLKFCSQKQAILLTSEDKNGLPPVAWAVRNDCIDAAFRLPRRHHFFQLPEGGRSGLGHYAVKYRAVRFLRALAHLAGSSNPGHEWAKQILNEVDEKGDSPMVYACDRMGDVALFRAIINGFPQALLWKGKNNENIFRRLIDNRTSQHGCIIENDPLRTPIFKCLLKEYPDLWTANNPGDLPAIALAAYLGRKDILELASACNPNLLEWVDPTTKKRLTHVAVKWASIQVLDFFLSKKPELLVAEDTDGQTPFMKGLELKCNENLTWHFKVGFDRWAELVLSHDLKIKLNFYKNTNSMCSTEEEQTLLIALKTRLPFFKPDNKGETALSLAVKNMDDRPITRYAEYATAPDKLSSPFQTALALAFTSTFARQDAEGNNLLHRIASWSMKSLEKEWEFAPKE